ncbi:hypothetical protein O6H91_01G006900 [Diphasiastrum complanatum]|nr:hypothetical protein O6H91_01G006900 [Diphasiastrum complanatum]
MPKTGACTNSCSNQNLIYRKVHSARAYQRFGNRGGKNKVSYYGSNSVAEASTCSLGSTFRHSSKKTQGRRIYVKTENEGSNDVGSERESGMLAVEGVAHDGSVNSELENKIDHGAEVNNHCSIQQNSAVTVIVVNLLCSEREVDVQGNSTSVKNSKKKKVPDEFQSGDLMTEATGEQIASAKLSLVSNATSYPGYNIQKDDFEAVQSAADSANLHEDGASQCSCPHDLNFIGSESESVPSATLDINIPCQRQVHSNSNHHRAASLEFLNQEIPEGELWDDKVEGKERKGGKVTDISFPTKVDPVVRNILMPLIDDQTVEQVTEGSSESVVEQVIAIVDHVADQAVQVGQKMVDQVSEVLPSSVLEQVPQVAEVIEQVTLSAAEQMLTSAVQATEEVSGQVMNLLTLKDEEDDDSDDEFETYKTSDLPEFRGIQGVQNFTILQEDEGILSKLYDFYTYMLKKPLPEFTLGMFAAPIFVSVIFTLLYLPELHGLVLDETARTFFESSGMPINVEMPVLDLTLDTVFHVFMFSVSLSTGLQPDIAPLSPYTLVIANINALVAQLVFVFLSGAVFARLSQPSQPVRCSTVAVICPAISRQSKQPTHRALMVRFVLAGPQPCELVDVKVDLSFKFNTITRSGSYFRATHSLKLMFHGSLQMRPEIAYLNHGMLVRHIIDETSPLYRRTHERLEKEDAIFVLSVIGLERSSMQAVFHVQQYSVHDNHVIWDAEFEDMILISKKNKRIVDHSKLSHWKPFALSSRSET